MRTDNHSWPYSFLRRPGWLRSRSAGILGLSLLSTLAVVVVSSQLKSLFAFVVPANYEVGQVVDRDITVERDVLYTDQEATRLRQEAVEKLVPPIFRLNEEIGDSKLRQLDEFHRALAKLLSEERSIERTFLKLQLNFPGVLQRQELDRLISRNAVEPVLSKVRDLLADTYSTGFLRLPEPQSDMISAGAVELWRWKEGKLEKGHLLLKDVLNRQNLSERLEAGLIGVPEDQKRLILRLAEVFAVENAFLDLEQTLKAKSKAVAEVEPVQAKLMKDQVILRKGDLITEEALVQLKALSEYSTSVSVSSISGTVLFVLLVYGFCLYLLNRKESRQLYSRKQLLFLCGTGLIYLVLAALSANLLEPPSGMPLAVMLPTAMTSMLVAMILSPAAGLVFSILVSLLLLPIVSLDLYSFVFAAGSALAAAAVVQRVERRIDLIRAGLLLSLFDSVLLVVIGLLRNASLKMLLPAVGWGLANGFLGSLAALGLMPVVEHLLNAASRFRLIELSDLNSPIMKRMLSLAPGTYSHSISVANLAESACNAMNANALLARVGAYYHDIGKIEQSEYFIENQNTYNKHDELKPSLSASVIKAHLKIGIEKARELELPEEIQDIIAQHHGRGVIKYFYHRALENDDSGNVPAEDYTYPGERPKTKEAAVVMLADTVEAASRTLKKPTIAKLEKFVWGIIMDKFTSNELGECDLTLAEMETIRRSFVQVLAGYFHSRIEYPKNKEAVH
jgi:putative nucleotidyltransferase with HDIG domain